MSYFLFSVSFHLCKCHKQTVLRQLCQDKSAIAPTYTLNIKWLINEENCFKTQSIGVFDFRIMREYVSLFSWVFTTTTNLLSTMRPLGKPRPIRSSSRRCDVVYGICRGLPNAMRQVSSSCLMVFCQLWDYRVSTIIKCCFISFSDLLSRVVWIIGSRLLCTYLDILL